MDRAHFRREDTQHLTAPLDSELVMSDLPSYVVGLFCPEANTFLTMPSGDWAERQVISLSTDNEWRWHLAGSDGVYFDSYTITDDTAVVIGLGDDKDLFLAAVIAAKGEIFRDRTNDRDPMMIEGNASII